MTARPFPISIEEWFKKEDNIVFRYWRITGSDHGWQREVTPYQDLPYILLPPRLLSDKTPRD